MYHHSMKSQHWMLNLILLTTILTGFSSTIFAQDTTTLPNWWRQTRDYNTKYHPWIPPATLEEWKQERVTLKQRILISQGLWPMPPKSPLQPVIHGRIEEDDYTIDKVFFASRPGLYVTGNLYRPKNVTGKMPGILSPHGHAPQGRFTNVPEGTAKQLIEHGDEVDLTAAKHYHQARMVQLARMGCVVFHYDMIGYADQQPLDHRWDFSTPEDGLWLIENMGLQTWNSIRSLDFLLSLEGVDPNRIGVTGASGGGTQTMILSAIDDRVAVSVPVVMVSTAMQGGCTCENAPYLRIDSNNIAFAAMFAPKPLAMIGADDWTIQLISRGYPELQQVYGLYDQRDHVAAWVHPEFKHNYNHVSRTHMYDWMNEHLKLNASIEERPFAGKTQEELTVFDQDHPLPDDAAIAEVLRKSIIDEAKQQYTDLITNGDPNQKTEIMQAAANILLGGPAPVSEDINVSLVTESNQQTGLVSRASDGRVVPVRIIQGDSNLDGTLFIFSEQGRDFSQEQIDQLSQEYSCGTVVLADISGTGTNRPQTSQSVNEKYYGYTSGYNLPLLSQKVRDISTVVMGISDQLKSSRIVLAGRDDEAVSVLLAQSQLSDVVSLADADFSAGSLREITSVNDPLFLPGFKKYGGISGLATINPCEKLVLRGVPEQQKNKLTDFQRLGKGRIIFKP